MVDRKQDLAFVVVSCHKMNVLHYTAASLKPLFSVANCWVCPLQLCTQPMWVGTNFEF